MQYTGIPPTSLLMQPGARDITFQALTGDFWQQLSSFVDVMRDRYGGSTYNESHWIEEDTEHTEVDVPHTPKHKTTKHI